MAKHFMNKDFGLVRPINKSEFLTFFDNFKLVAPIDDSWIFKEVRSVYLKPKLGDVVIDGGAHYGFYTMLASRLVGRGGLILAFEPSFRNYRRLLTNLRLNKIENVRTFNMALGDFDGEGKLYLSGYPREHSMVFQRSKYFEPVKVRRLDNITDELGLNKVNLIKLDTEGAELKILKGALSTIKRFRPGLTIAAYHYDKESEMIIGWLKENASFYHIKRTSLGIVHAEC
jgi:FkbM family methyltransferase